MRLLLAVLSHISIGRGPIAGGAPSATPTAPGLMSNDTSPLPPMPPPPVPPPPFPDITLRQQWLALLAYTGLGFAGALAALITILCACFASRGWRLRRSGEPDPTAPVAIRDWNTDAQTTTQVRPRHRNIKVIEREGVLVLQPGGPCDQGITWVGVRPSLDHEDTEAGTRSPRSKEHRGHPQSDTAGSARHSLETGVTVAAQGSGGMTDLGSRRGGGGDAGGQAVELVVVGSGQGEGSGMLTQGASTATSMQLAQDASIGSTSQLAEGSSLGHNTRAATSGSSLRLAGTGSMEIHTWLVDGVRQQGATLQEEVEVSLPGQPEEPESRTDQDCGSVSPTVAAAQGPCPPEAHVITVSAPSQPGHDRRGHTATQPQLNSSLDLGAPSPH